MDYQPILQQLYQDFNARTIDAVLAHMQADVDWPNGWEGGYITGQNEVRAYWLRQWQHINPTVEPVSFVRRSENQVAVGVHQVIKDLNGQVLSDGQVTHVYTFKNGKVQAMRIEP